MVRAKRKRNSQILNLHRQGVSRSSLAAKHHLTNGRIAQIVAASSPVDERRAELEAQYGKRPNISQLSDDAPFDVLILANSQTHGWAVRILALAGGRKPIKTLGELRAMSDADLHTRRGVGAGLFAELRVLCPHAPATRTEPAPEKPGRRPSARPAASALRGH